MMQGNDFNGFRGNPIARPMLADVGIMTQAVGILCAEGSCRRR